MKREVVGVGASSSEGVEGVGEAGEKVATGETEAAAARLIPAVTRGVGAAGVL